MIDISTALANILRANYGKDVRASIHDAIYQINDISLEAVDLAQIKFGTDVSSPTSPTTGYNEGNVYFNVVTGVIWRLDGGSWTKLGSMKSISSISKTSTSGLVDDYTINFNDGTTSTFQVTNGDKGVSVQNITKTGSAGGVDHYEVNLSDGTTTPTGFDVTNGKDGVSISSVTLASTIGNTKTYDINLSDGTKTPTGFSVEDGTSSYVYIRYSSQFDGTGMVSVPTATTVFIGICVTNQNTAPTSPSVYNWVKFIGDSGTGTGDMLKSDYATKYVGVVDKAAALYDGSNEILANELLDKTTYCTKGITGTVDKATELIDVVNSKTADTELLANLSDVGGQLKYKGTDVGTDYINDVSADFTVTSKKLELASTISTKLSNAVTELKVNNTVQTITNNSVNIPSASTSVYGVTKLSSSISSTSEVLGATAKAVKTVNDKVDTWFSQTQSASATGEQTITFTGLNTSKAYELWFDTSDGSQVGLKSSKLTGTSMAYTVDIPSDCPVPVTFKLLVKNI